MVPRLSEALTVGAVVVRPPWHSFAEAAHGLVHELVVAERLAGRLEEQALRAVTEREAIASTAVVEIGVSIPHARLEGITGVVAALAVSPTAVYYAHAEVPITIMALVLSSPLLSGEHLNFLSSLSLLLQSAATRRSLQNATTPVEVFEYIRAQER
jgi:mannitol/fructose-specific phosphotransferase system IIA component (Ntr-type)